MGRITNAVLLAKQKSMHEDIKEIKGDVKQNTEFRLKANGIIGAIAFVATIFGGAIVWIMNKVWKP